MAIRNSTRSNVIRIAQPERHAALHNVHERLYVILAELDCARAVLMEASPQTEIECRAANVLHHGVKKLEVLFNDLDRAIIEASNGQGVSHG